MKKLVDIMLKRLENGEDTMILSIVENVGSAPRHTGAAMLVSASGYVAGTIGGGMLEYRCIQLAQEDLAKGQGTLRQFRLTKDEVAGLGMVCGGDVDVLFTIVKSNEENKNTLMTIQSRFESYGKGYIVLSMDGNEIHFADESNVWDYKHANIHEKAYYITSLDNPSRIFIFGGGHLAQELVPLITHLGFRCVVTDDRAEFSTKELFPQAEELHTYNYAKLNGKFNVQPQDYIIAMTRGHLGDLDVQKFALKTPAYYIGVVGSKSKIKAVNEKLRDAGFSNEDIARITTPIGIKIHSETPAEIAVSIAAQLIEKRAEYKLKP